MGIFLCLLVLLGTLDYIHLATTYTVLTWQAVLMRALFAFLVGLTACAWVTK